MTSWPLPNWSRRRPDPDTMEYSGGLGMGEVLIIFVIVVILFYFEGRGPTKPA